MDEEEATCMVLKCLPTFLEAARGSSYMVDKFLSTATKITLISVNVNKSIPWEQEIMSFKYVIAMQDRKAEELLQIRGR